MRYELNVHEWRVIKPMLPYKPRGVPSVDDRRVLNGIFWVLRSGAPWRDLPKSYGPHTTCYDRFVRWRRAGIWHRIMNGLATAHDAAMQMIDTSVVRMHQHGACIAENRKQHMGRSRDGLTSKVHAVVDGRAGRRLKTSRSQLDRILDPANDQVSLASLVRTAHAVGKRVRLELEDAA
jgi:transposase